MKNPALEVEISVALEARPSALKPVYLLVSAIGFSSLRDELPEFRRKVLEMIGSL